MDATEQSITIASTAISLSMLWVLFFWLWKDYRLDRFRQDLFATRDELFDLATAHSVDYSHPAYGLLRSTINGAIQYGHRLGLLNILVFAVAVPHDKSQRVSETAYRERWTNAIDSLDKETRDAIVQLRNKVFFCIAKQFIFSSLVLLVVLVPATVLVIALKVHGELSTYLKQKIERSFLNKLLLQLAYRMDITAQTLSGNSSSCPSRIVVN